MNVLDLFSGIGGFSLGLERAGMRTVAFCECDPYCRRVLAKHWPNVPIYDDVRTLTAERLMADSNGGRFPQFEKCNGKPQSRIKTSQRDDIIRLDIDLICGGFPCQDISVAGKGTGIGGERSGLWSEFARIIGEIRPKYAIVENVSALLGRGIERVLGDLAALGFDAEWHCIPASAVGAPHRRDRVWIVAYPSGAVADVSRPRLPLGPGTLAEWAHAATTGERWWATEPDVGRVVDGPAARVDRRSRLIALGNSLVPAIPEIIGRAIMTAVRFDRFNGDLP